MGRDPGVQEALCLRARRLEGRRGPGRSRRRRRGGGGAHRALGRPRFWAELKYDGYRGIVLVEEDRVGILSRRGSDLTGAFPDVATAAGQMLPPERSSTESCWCGQATVLTSTRSSDGWPRRLWRGGWPRASRPA
ncbi:hypothetical protein [Nocardioides terrae]|uniref:ATP-dependent DNA ligase n=1 Tax=Nocardioides terrae TaxID=574651 RepID=UPI0015875542